MSWCCSLRMASSHVVHEGSSRNLGASQKPDHVRLELRGPRSRKGVTRLSRSHQYPSCYGIEIQQMLILSPCGCIEGQRNVFELPSTTWICLSQDFKLWRIHSNLCGKLQSGNQSKESLVRDPYATCLRAGALDETSDMPCLTTYHV